MTKKKLTEAEWQTSTDPARMLLSLRGKASERKLRLFACACIRRHWGVVREEEHRLVEL